MGCARKFQRPLSSARLHFNLRSVRGVDTAKHADFSRARRLGDPVYAHVVIDDGFFREPPAAEVAG